MCGILCLVDPKAAPDALAAAAVEMRDALRLRGPDAEGLVVEPDLGLALGHRRLSIQDLSDAGAQPMVSRCGRYLLSYNGEIYNVRSLRARLDEAAPTPWRGRSDTEVLLEAIACWGLRTALTEARGMFALILYDRAERTLSLARDAFGEKPLVAAVWNGRLAIASDLRAFRRHPDWDDRFDDAAMLALLTYGYVPAPRTISVHARKIAPGSIVEIPLAAATAPDKWRRTRFFDAREEAARARRDRFAGDVADAEERLEELLTASIERQMISDAPLGALLSGGIDSSTVVSLATRRLGVEMKTFSLGFEEEAFDESPFARAVAEHLGTDHHEIRMSEADAIAMLDRMPEIYDEPFADVSMSPTAMVMAFARNEVTVALTGDGGDELFEGYSRYQRLERVLAPRAPRVAQRMLLGQRAGLAEIAARVTGRADLRLLEKHEQAPRGADGPAAALDRMVRAPGARVTRRAPLAPDGDGLDALSAEEGWSVGETGTMLDIERYLPDDILVKTDRASMAVSLETRAPLLDIDVARFAFSLPSTLRNAGGTPKGLLKRVLGRHAPTEIWDRPKRGFVPPFERWLTGPFREELRHALSRDGLGGRDFFDARALDGLWRTIGSGRKTSIELVWRLFMLNRFIEAAAARND